MNRSFQNHSGEQYEQPTLMLTTLSGRRSVMAVSFNGNTEHQDGAYAGNNDPYEEQQGNW